MRTVKIPEPGDVVVVRAKRNFDLCTSNDLGGTQELPPGLYRVRVEKSWDDYETGRRCIGTLLDPKDIETSRKVGTTPYKPKKNFHPERVYFHANEVVAELKGD